MGRKRSKIEGETAFNIIIQNSVGKLGSKVGINEVDPVDPGDPEFECTRSIELSSERGGSCKLGFSP